MLALRPLGLLLLALAATAATAQPSGLSIAVGFDRAGIDATPFDRFTDSYNAFYEFRAVRPFESVSESYLRPVVGVTGRLATGGLTVGYGYQYAPRRTQTISTDLDGVEQEVALSVTDHVALVELTVPIGPLTVGGVFSAAYRHDRIAVELIYPDGSRSRGSESRLNGLYTADAGYLEVGPTLGLSVGNRIYVPVRVLFPVYIGGGEGIALTDDDLYELNSDFPSDWDRYLADPSGLDDENDVTDQDMTGLRVQAGIEFRLF